VAAAAWKSMVGCPCPPYMHREPTGEDRERYQTVYARQPGAVAAPTAGLHFDRRCVERLAERGVRADIHHLHVGAGTFQPLRVGAYCRTCDGHAEWIEVGAAACEANPGGAGRAVGGSLAGRHHGDAALETAAGDEGVAQPWKGETRIFIYPGYRFRCVDALIPIFTCRNPPCSCWWPPSPALRKF